MRFAWSPERGALNGRSVFLSASVPDPKGHPRFLQGPVEESLMLLVIDRRVDDAVRSLLAQVLGAGGRIVHGGHPKIFPALAHQASQWKPSAGVEPPIQIYQSEFFRKMEPPPGRETLEKSGLAVIRWVSPDLDAEAAALDIPRALIERRLPKQFRGEFGPIHRALLAMRLRMLIESQPASAVCLGGMEGIEAEAELYLELAKMGRIPPAEQVQVIGSTYGAAAQLEGDQYHRADRLPGQAQSVRSRAAATLEGTFTDAFVEQPRRTRKETVYDDIEKRVSYDGVMRFLVQRITDKPG